jgi:hypothetical protein
MYLNFYKKKVLIATLQKKIYTNEFIYCPPVKKISDGGVIALTGLFTPCYLMDRSNRGKNVRILLYIYGGSYFLFGLLVCDNQILSPAAGGVNPTLPGAVLSHRAMLWKTGKDVRQQTII